MMKCLDSYALVEICDGNPNFMPLLKEKTAITDLTMTEFYANLYKKYGTPTADYWHRKLNSLCRFVSREILIKAVKYRIDNNKQKLSFFDCVGYVYACENKMVFVTGDKEFKEKPNVEFMQK